MIGNRFFGVDWFGVKHISSAIWGLPVGFLTMVDCLEIHERSAKEIQDFVESVRYPKGLNSVRRVKSKVKSQAGGNHAASTEAVKIVVIQLANYTLAFFMWMIAGKFCSPFIRNKENIMNKFFVKLQILYTT